MKTEITPTIIWALLIAFSICACIAFFAGLRHGLKKGEKLRDEQSEKFAEWCDDNASKDDRTKLWFGNQLGIDRHHAVPTKFLLSIFKGRFTKYQ